MPWTRDGTNRRFPFLYVRQSITATSEGHLRDSTRRDRISVSGALARKLPDAGGARQRPAAPQCGVADTGDRKPPETGPIRCDA